MFQVRPEDKWTLLDEERSKAFHHMLEHLMFATSGSKKDIKMSIAFLCTRVRIPYKHYWGKLVRLLRCIRVTLHLPLILRAYILSVIKCWVNLSFNAHPDYKVHTVDMMSMGSGSIR